ncbi:hypothetical protein SDC9_74444 [bioreactor metagenome]|uniref:Protein-export protein SecB n=1 Tax=bioreactor metagenome TaxID=1076179 RepID=A0A644YIU2_9ZZZZ
MLIKPVPGDKENPMPLEDTIGSIVKITKVVFDEVSFIRKGFKNLESEPLLSIGGSVNKISDGEYRVVLKLDVSKENEYDIAISISGFCSIDEECQNKDDLLQKNVTAILFPYARAELTLITSQPETDSLVLPEININEMFKHAVQTQTEPQ